MEPTLQSVAGILDETIESLSVLDHERLLSLEQRILSLAKSGGIDNLPSSLLERHHVLHRMLLETQSNLAILTRLHNGDGRDVWER